MGQASKEKDGRPLAVSVPQEPWKLPKAFLEKPILILDSGQSVAESVFLERWRAYLYKRIQRVSNVGSKPFVWLIYPTPNLWARYGSSDEVSGYEEYEIRPIRKNGRLEGAGFLATVAQYEESCFFHGAVPPWRKFNSKKRRPVGVMLNPSALDLQFLRRNFGKLKNKFNIPEFHMGAPPDRRMPLGFTAYTDLIWTFDDEASQRLRDSIEPRFARTLDFHRLWKKKKEHANEASVALNWRNATTRRHPDIAEKWGSALGLETYRARDDGTWQDFLLGTDCSAYILATAKEQVPFDAMIALARGATLVAPDVPLFQHLPGKRMLYPAKMNGDRIIWSQSEVEHYLRGKQHGLDSSYGHSTD